MKTKFLSALLVIFFIGASNSALASASNLGPSLNDYYNIVESVSKKYGLEINFTPTNDMTISAEEFRTLLEGYARIEYEANVYSKMLTAKAAMQANVSYPIASDTAQFAPMASEVVSKVQNGWRIGATASYTWNATNQKYFFTGGHSVFVENGSAVGTKWFEINTSSCQAIDSGRTLFVSATGTANYLDPSLGLISFPNTTYSVEIYYTALSVN